MGDTTKPDPSVKAGHSGPPTSAEFLKAMFTESLDDAKRDILAQVKDLIDQVYVADFESVEAEPEGAQTSPENSPDTVVESKIYEFIQPKEPDAGQLIQAMIHSNHLRKSSVLGNKNIVSHKHKFGGYRKKSTCIKAHERKA